MKRKNTMNVEVVGGASYDWLDALAEAEGCGSRPIGDGWHTKKEIADKTGWPPNRVKAWCTDGVGSGRLLKFRGVENGHCQFWYKEAQKTKEGST
jgi:hypothetical protein